MKTRYVRRNVFKKSMERNLKSEKNSVFYPSLAVMNCNVPSMIVQKVDRGMGNHALQDRNK